MLKYFFDYTGISEVEKIKQNISDIKKKIINKEYLLSTFSDEEYDRIFKHIKRIAIDVNNEQLANSQYVLRKYYELFLNIYKYFNLLCIGSYQNSWPVLQDCIDLAEEVGKYTSVNCRYDVPDILKMLYAYEALYPYKIFASSEMGITESECSICGKSMLGFECPHIKGHLYWGEVAYEIVKNVNFQAVALVSNPLDKRCVMSISGDTRTEEEKFKLLDYFVSNSNELLVMFKIEEQITQRKRDDAKNVGRNERCPCGSGKKFKKCCGKDIYYEHVHHIIRFENEVHFKVIT